MKREFAFDKRFNFYIIAGILISFLTYLLTDMLIHEFEPEILIFPIVFFGLDVFIWINALFNIPCGYLFNKQDITVIYVFSKNQRILWNRVYQIEIDYFAGEPGRYGRKFFTVEYIISYTAPEDNSKGTENIRRSRKIKRMIEKYWDGTVEGYFSDKVKKWFNKRSKKKQTAKKQYLTDEIAPMEREARAELRETLNQIQHTAESENLIIQAGYVYITRNGDEYTSRPNENYTYTAHLKLFRKDEIDDPRIKHFTAELLYVRAGKAKWRGTKNSDALTTLEAELNETLAEIRKSGFDTYCDNYSIYFKSLSDN